MTECTHTHFIKIFQRIFVLKHSYSWFIVLQFKIERINLCNCIILSNEHIFRIFFFVNSITYDMTDVLFVCLLIILNYQLNEVKNQIEDMI